MHLKLLPRAIHLGEFLLNIDPGKHLDLGTQVRFFTKPAPMTSKTNAHAAAAAAASVTTIIDRLRRPRFRGLRFI